MANQGSKKSSSSLESAIWLHSDSSLRGKSHHANTVCSEQTDEDSTSYKSRANSAKHSGYWEMHINWNLEHELDLHNLLKHCEQNGVSAPQIGESLVSMLYQCDGHLSYRVTKMVDRCESYGTIGLDMLEHYNIRYVRGNPLWDDHCEEDSGMSSNVQISHHSGDSHRVSSSSGSSYGGSTRSGSSGGSPYSGLSRIKGLRKVLRC